MDNKTTPNSNEDFLAQWIEGSLSDDKLRTMVSEQDFAKFIKLRLGIELYEQLEAPMDTSLVEIRKKIDSTTTVRTKQSKVIPLYLRIGIVAAASLLLFFGIKQFFGNTMVSETSGFGEQRTVAFLDGSTVILNAKSELKYDKADWDTQRNVVLNGEAFFKVKPGNVFTVKTKNGSVTVLGTHFNVNTFNGFFETVCYQGKVKVESNKEEFRIAPRQSVRNSQGRIITEDLKLVEESPSWMNGTSSFRNRPLHHAIRELENQFNVQIDANDINDAVLFTGSFGHEDLKKALATVFDSFGIRYSVLEDKISLSE